VDFESISSLDMELNSISSRKIDERDLPSNKEEAKNEPSPGDEDDPLKDKEIKLILAGGLVLSPVRGKDVGNLMVANASYYHQRFE